MSVEVVDLSITLINMNGFSINLDFETTLALPYNEFGKTDSHTER